MRQVRPFYFILWLHADLICPFSTFISNAPQYFTLTHPFSTFFDLPPPKCDLIHPFLTFSSNAPQYFTLTRLFRSSFTQMCIGCFAITTVFSRAQPNVLPDTKHAHFCADSAIYNDNCMPGCAFVSDVHVSQCIQRKTCGDLIGGGDAGVVHEVLKHDTVQQVVLCDIDEVRR